MRLGLTTGEAHDNRLFLSLLSRLKSGAMLLADRGSSLQLRGITARLPTLRSAAQSAKALCGDQEMTRASDGGFRVRTSGARSHQTFGSHSALLGAI